MELGGFVVKDAIAPAHKHDALPKARPCFLMKLIVIEKIEHEHDYEQEGSFRARRHDCLWPIQIPVTPLKLGFQFHFELGKIDQVPAREIPMAIFLPRLMLEAGDEVDGVVAHFVRRDLGFEIERAETALAAADGI